MKTYTEEFKKTIVELYENGNKNKSELAREYGTSEGNVRVWIAMYWVNSNISSIEHFATLASCRNVQIMLKLKLEIIN